MDSPDLAFAFVLVSLGHFLGLFGIVFLIARAGLRRGAQMMVIVAGVVVIVSTAQFVLADRWSALALFIVAGFMLLPAFLGTLLGHWAGTRAHLRKARA